MTIGFDAKRANANFTGLGNYSRFVIDSLSGQYAGDSFLMYIPRFKSNSRFDVLNERANTRTVLPAGKLAKALPSLWRSSLITDDLQRDGVELFHGLSNELPKGMERTGIKSVVTIHDLIFLRYPQFYKTVDRMIYTEKFRRACKTADRIVAVSECTRNDIVELFGIDSDKIEVIYQSHSPIFSSSVEKDDIELAKRRYHLPERYLLNVGSIETRKNLMLVVKALRHMPHDLHLVAVGKHTPYTDEVIEYAADNNLTDRVHLIHDMDFALLPAIYKSAELLVYPSVYEGFGIPIIEALSIGIPVIAATGSCLQEAGGSGSAYVSPHNAEELAKVAMNIISDTALRNKMIADGRNHVVKFNPQRLTEQMHDCYKRVLEAR